MKRFESRRVVVTGAASGIGRASALRLADEGARVVCCDLAEEGAKETASAIASAGGQALYGAGVGSTVDAAKLTEDGARRAGGTRAQRLNGV